MIKFAFFGTPSFSVPSLIELHRFCQSNNHHLAFVLCQPDKPSGRGLQLHSCPVKETALSLGLPVYQPETLKSSTESGLQVAQLLKEQQIDMVIVVAYGKIIPSTLLTIPPFGFINVHASLLPKWRGAAPIQRSIEAGDTHTGVAIMNIEKTLDTGPVCLSSKLPITSEDNTASLTEKLSLLGAQTLTKALPGIIDKTLPFVSQNHDEATYAHMIEKSEGLIDWNMTTQQLMCKMRAMTPWPGNFTNFSGKSLSLYFPQLSSRPADKTYPPGTVTYAREKLIVACKDGALEFSEGKLAGKRQMPIKDLLNGLALKEGDVLGE